MLCIVYLLYYVNKHQEKKKIYIYIYILLFKIILFKTEN